MAQAKSGTRLVRLFVGLCTIMMAVCVLGVAPASAVDDPYTTDCTIDSGTVCRVHFTDISQSIDYVLPDYVTSVDATVVGGTGSHLYTISEAPHTAKSISFTLIISEQLGHVISVQPGGIGSGPEPYSGGRGGFASFASMGQLWGSCCLGYGANGSVLHYGSDYVAGGTGSDEDLLSERGGNPLAWNEGTLTGPRGGVGLIGQCQDPNLGSSCQVVAWTEGSGGGGGVIGGGTGRPGVVMVDGYRHSNWAVPSGGGAGLSTTGIGISESTVQTSSGASGWVDIYYAKINRPSAPGISNLTYLPNGVSVDLSAPASTGGAGVTNYEYSTDGGLTWAPAVPAQTSGPIVIPDLSNGTTYSVRVRAVNAAGSGTASEAISVKPVVPASAPGISSIVAGSGQAILSIGAPAEINDSSLLGYDYSINNGLTWSRFASVDDTFTITGLTNGTAYQVKVRAVNSAGPGAASDAVTVNPIKLVPAVPSIASISRGNGQATVNVKAPTGVTAQSITGYQYNINNGALWNPVTLTDGSFTVTGLPNGTNYSFKIRAVNANGLSGMSGKVSVTPMTTASATTIQSIKSLNGGLAVTFGGAINNGGSVARNYQYSLDGGSTWTSCSPALKLGPLMTIKGLTNGTTYQVSIRVVNAVGPGEASNVVSGTPTTTPGAPSITSATAGKTTITVNFTAPTNNGGAAVTNYAYTVDGRTWTTLSPASASTQIVITGLTSYKAYSVKLRAINSAGLGAISAGQSVKTLK